MAVKHRVLQLWLPLALRIGSAEDYLWYSRCLLPAMLIYLHPYIRLFVYGLYLNAGQHREETHHT